MYWTVGTAGVTAGANAVAPNGAAAPFATAGAEAAAGWAAFTEDEPEKYDVASAPAPNANSATTAAPMLVLICDLLWNRDANGTHDRFPVGD